MVFFNHSGQRTVVVVALMGAKIRLSAILIKVNFLAFCSKL